MPWNKCGKRHHASSENPLKMMFVAWLFLLTGNSWKCTGNPCNHCCPCRAKSSWWRTARGSLLSWIVTWNHGLYYMYSGQLELCSLSWPQAKILTCAHRYLFCIQAVYRATRHKRVQLKQVSSASPTSMCKAVGCKYVTHNVQVVAPNKPFSWRDIHTKTEFEFEKFFEPKY